jgi:hypothetical protein
VFEQQNSTLNSINIEHLALGVYVLEIINAHEKKERAKFIKQ